MIAHLPRGLSHVHPQSLAESRRLRSCPPALGPPHKAAPTHDAAPETPGHEAPPDDPAHEAPPDESTPAVPQTASPAGNLPRGSEGNHPVCDEQHSAACLFQTPSANIPRQHPAQTPRINISTPTSLQRHRFSDIASATSLQQRHAAPVNRMAPRAAHAMTGSGRSGATRSPPHSHGLHPPRTFPAATPTRTFLAAATTLVIARLVVASPATVDCKPAKNARNTCQCRADRAASAQNRCKTACQPGLGHAAGPIMISLPGAQHRCM